MPFPAARRIRSDDLHGRQVDERDLVGVLHRRDGVLAIRMKQHRMWSRIRTEIEPADNPRVDDVNEDNVPSRRAVRPVLARQRVASVG